MLLLPPPVLRWVLPSCAQEGRGAATQGGATMPIPRAADVCCLPGNLDRGSVGSEEKRAFMSQSSRQYIGGDSGGHTQACVWDRSIGKIK